MTNLAFARFSILLDSWFFSVDTRWLDKIWIIFFRDKNNILPLENKVPIFAPPCNFITMLQLYYGDKKAKHICLIDPLK